MRTKVNNRLGLDLRAAQFSEQIRRTVPQLNFPPNFNGNVILLRGNSWPVPGSKIVGKRESERQAKSRPCGEKFPPVLFSCSRFLDSADSTQSQILEQATILEKIKWNSKPPSPSNQGWSRAPDEGKNAPFSHPWFGGRGGLDFPFILSKIVGGDSWPASLTQTAYLQANYL